MLHHYSDIRDRLDEPQWWDESGVPRYCDFAVNRTADIYCREACLLLIACQDCGHRFKVCMSAGECAFGPKGLELTRGSLAAAVLDGSLHFGDPPNIDCCPSGPTMNCVDLRVLQFWSRKADSHVEWERRPELEVDLPDATGYEREVTA
jgi:hypothetical protein